MPLHLRLALPNAKSSLPDGHADHRRWFVVAAMLDALRVAKLIDVKPSIERLNRDDEIQELQPARKLTAPINQTITGEARQHSRDQELFHRAHLTYAAGKSYRPGGSRSSLPLTDLIWAPKIGDRGRRICYDKPEAVMVQLRI